MSAKSSRKEKDTAMASMMKENPGRFPDSVMRPHRGCGVGDRDLAKKMGRVSNNTTTFDRGMLGGHLCAILGMGKFAGFEA